MNKEELLFNDIYNQTQDFGRTQFVREIVKLQQKVNQLETNRDEAIKRIKDQMKYLEDVKDFYSDEQDFKDMCFPIINSDWSNYDDMSKILERGKE